MLCFIFIHREIIKLALMPAGFELYLILNVFYIKLWSSYYIVQCWYLYILKRFYFSVSVVSFYQQNLSRLFLKSIYKLSIQFSPHFLLFNSYWRDFFLLINKKLTFLYFHKFFTICINTRNKYKKYYQLFSLYLFFLGLLTTVMLAILITY